MVFLVKTNIFIDLSAIDKFFGDGLSHGWQFSGVTVVVVAGFLLEDVVGVDFIVVCDFWVDYLGVGVEDVVVFWFEHS